MKSVLIKSLISVVLLAALPVIGYAQEATLTGMVSDSTGGVLPGVTITAVHDATGNTFTAVTDQRGNFRVPIRVGGYTIRAELAGFTTVNRTAQILIGQTAVLNVQMAPASVAETVTVTGELPLVNTSTSTVGANIDPKQMQELPINGRNWMDLTLLAPGARRNEGGGYVQQRQGYSQTNVDGQQVTTIYHSGGDDEQTGFSRDAIAEFQVIANQFDATIGRSAGMVVNAITKSGANTVAGTFGGYFRNDKFNAEDFVSHRVLPYSNQQLSLTVGGPIIKDRLHYFGAYEFEREPKTFTYNTPYPSFNQDFAHTDKTHKPVGRLDYQFTSATRLSVRGSGYHREFGVGGGATSPNGNSRVHRRIASQYSGILTHVISTRSVNEIQVGRTDYERADQPTVRWKGGDFPYHPVLNGGSVIVMLRGITIGASPLNIFQDTTTARDDFTTAYELGGHHDVKIGGEYMRFGNQFKWCLRCDGVIDARGGPVPANLEQLFPNTQDPSTWNLTPLAPITIRVIHSISDTEHQYQVVRHIFAGWVQDDWKTSRRLTLNLGLRYDVDSNGHSEKVNFLPWLPGNLPLDKNNVAPRLGANFALNDRTVLRGGYGLFFAFAPNDGVQQTEGYLHRFEYEIANDGRPNFTANQEGWFNGPKPTWNQALQNACDINLRPGCSYRSLIQEINYPYRQTSYSHKVSAGLQRQFGDDMSFEANYVYTGGRGEEPNPNGGNVTYNINMSYNPATGANYPFSDTSHRPFPGWGVVNFELLDGWSNYHGGDFTFTKRFSHRWQASATYTLSYFKDAYPKRDQWYLGPDGVVARRPIDFALVPDMGGEYTFAEGDQRHRANVNGIWDIGYGVQLSGLYFYGSGARFFTFTGVDRRNEGAQGEERLRANGTIMPRNDQVGDPIHRVDLRLQKKVGLGGGKSIDGVFELFNVFNHANYGSYTTNESNVNYRQPSFSGNVAYQPRMLQLGFRMTF